MGGKFSFPDPQNDTFIRGLHARIVKLRVEWSGYFEYFYTIKQSNCISLYSSGN
jgi:hypothetical protein